MSIVIKYTWEQLNRDIGILSKRILQIPSIRAVYGVPTGGLIPAVLIAHKTGLALERKPERISPQVVVVDDLISSGRTIQKLLKRPEKRIIVSLWAKENFLIEPLIVCNIQKEGEMIVFPWGEHK